MNKDNQKDNNIPEELAEALKLADDNLKGWQRAAAEFENYKRRDEQLHAELVVLGQNQIIQAFLLTLEDLERLLTHIPEKLEDISQWQKGLEGVYKNWQESLKQLGLEKVKTVGAKFNPEEQEAVMMVEGEKDGMIAEEVAPGYKRNGKLLTPAKVKVYKS